jgi:dienelactone hydrolase
MHRRIGWLAAALACAGLVSLAWAEPDIPVEAPPAPEVKTPEVKAPDAPAATQEAPETEAPPRTSSRYAGLYKPELGPHEVQAVPDYTFSIVTRDVPLRISFPKDGGPYPVLLWLHGALGSKDGYQPLVKHWVSHGYVVIQPTFGDSLTYLDGEERQEFNTAAKLVNSEHVMSQWDDRPEEVTILINRLDELEQKVPGMAGKMQKDNLAVGGHSYGAHTTLLLAGVPARVGWRKTRSFADERIKAFLLVSPSGTTRLLPRSSMEQLGGPALIVTGDNDDSPVKGQEGKKGDWRRETFDYAQGGSLYLLWIEGAYHNFGGISGSARWRGAGPADDRQVQIVASTCLALLDGFLRDSSFARDYLRSDELDQGTHRDAWIKSK